MAATPTFDNIPEDKRTRILDASLQEFAAHGFAGASLNRLARQCGIAKGSLFQYFSNKQGLFQCVVDHGVALFADRLRQARQDTASLPLEERLTRLLVEGVAFSRQQPHLFSLLLRIARTPQAGGAQAHAVMAATLRQLTARFLLPLLEAARQRGEVAPDIRPEAAIFLVETLAERFLAEFHADPGLDLDLARRRAGELARLMLHGLAHGAPAC